MFSKVRNKLSNVKSRAKKKIGVFREKVNEEKNNLDQN